MTVRVMHLTYDMRIGGTEMVIKNLIEGNDDPTIEMSIFCIETPLGPWGEELQAAGIPITTQARQPGFDTRLIGAIRGHIKEHNIDILHCHQYTPWVYGALAAAFTKTKVIFTEHGRFYPDASSWKRRWVNPILLKLTDHVTAISKATKQALVDYEFIPAERIEVIYNGIKPLIANNEDVQRLRDSLGLSGKHYILGTVARLDPIKNQKMMINAFSSVLQTQPEAKLIIVGDGEEMSSLREQVKQLGIQNSVIFTGYKPQPSAYIALIVVFLLSSFSEGTSMTLLEAMSLGKPCIVTNVGGNPEIITNGTNGYVTPNDDAEEFAKATVALLKDQNLYEKMSGAAQQVFNEKFNVTDMSQRYHNLYRGG